MVWAAAMGGRWRWLTAGRCGRGGEDGRAKERMGMRWVRGKGGVGEWPSIG